MSTTLLSTVPEVSTRTWFSTMASVASEGRPDWVRSRSRASGRADRSAVRLTASYFFGVDSAMATPISAPINVVAAISILDLAMPPMTLHRIDQRPPAWVARALVAFVDLVARRSLARRPAGRAARRPLGRRLDPPGCATALRRREPRRAARGRSATWTVLRAFALGLARRFSRGERRSAKPPTRFPWLDGRVGFTRRLRAPARRWKPSGGKRGKQRAWPGLAARTRQAMAEPRDRSQLVAALAAGFDPELRTP